MTRIRDDVKLDFKDVLIEPKRSTLKSRKEVELCKEYKFLNSHRKFNGVPIFAANMDTVGTKEMAKSLVKHKMATTLHKHLTVPDMVKIYLETPVDELQYIWFSIGVLPGDLEKFRIFYNSISENDLKKVSNNPPNVCIDVANGYTEIFLGFIEDFRSEFYSCPIMAGNVVTSEMTQELLLRGADIVKTGIGPGSACSTREKTGVGYPQLSAILECADAAHGLDGHVCADGGITCPGDLAKAFGAGADFVMMGGVFAGHVECADRSPQSFFYDPEKTPAYPEDKKELTDEDIELIVRHKSIYLMPFYGMSSKKANEKYGSGLKNYRASEGRELLVPVKGYVSDTVQEYLGGLRSACTYAGARRLKDLPKCTTFIRVNRQLNESLKSYE